MPLKEVAVVLVIVIATAQLLMSLLLLALSLVVCLLLCFAFLAPGLVLFASAECLKGPFFLSSLAPLLTFLREVFTTFLEVFFVGVERTTRVAARVACVARVALVALTFPPLVTRSLLLPFPDPTRASSLGGKRCAIARDGTRRRAMIDDE